MTVAAENDLQRAMRLAGIKIPALEQLVRVQFPDDAVSEQQLRRVVNGERGASAGLAAALEDVLKDKRGRPRVTAAEIARLPRRPRVTA